MLKILLKDDDDLKLAHEKYKTFTRDRRLKSMAISREKAERDKIYFENLAKRKAEEAMRKGREKGLKQGIEQGIEQGREKGTLDDKHNVLIRMLDLKYGLSEDEKDIILSVDDISKLDSALDAFVLSGDKESIFKSLK